MAATTDGEQKVLAAAQQIVKSLHSSTNVNADDMILLFSSIDTRFANLSNLMQTSSSSNQVTPAPAATDSPSSTSSPSIVAGGGGGGDEDSLISPKNQAGFQLETAEDLIHRWESNGDESGIEDYLRVVDHIIQLTEDLGFEPVGEAGDGEVRDRAENALQLAMTRLEEEFRHTLIRNTVPLDIDRLEGSLIRRSSLSSSTSADGIIHEIPDFESGAGSFADNSADPDGEISGRYHRHVAGASLGGDELSHDLVNPDAIIHAATEFWGSCGHW